MVRKFQKRKRRVKRGTGLHKRESEGLVFEKKRRKKKESGRG